VRVMLCHPSSELYGADRMALVSATGLAERGHEITVVLPARGELETAFGSAGLDIRVVKVPVLRKSSLGGTGIVRTSVEAARALPGAIRLLMEVRPDVVYVNTIVQPSWMLAARLCRMPLVVHVREIESGLPLLVRRALIAPLKLAQAVVCNSQSARDFVVGSQPKLNTRAIVAYNGKDWSQYFEAGRKRRGGMPIVALVGRLSPRKGQDLLVAAVAKLAAGGTEVGCRLIGNVFKGNEWFRDELVEQIRLAGLQDRVKLVGFSDDVASELAAADVVAVPSRQEPFGTVALEAMAAHRVVVAANIEGLREIVVDGESGVLFEPGDPDDLARALGTVIKDSTFRAGLESAAFERVNRDFSLERYMDIVEEALCQAAGRSGFGKETS